MADKVIYRLTRPKSNVVILRQPFMYKKKDKNGKTIKQGMVQYSKTADSIWVNEQLKVNPKALRDALYFKKGDMHVEVDDKLMMEIIKIHPDNVANGGNKFKLLDIEKDELFEIEQWKEADKAKVLVSDAKEDTVRGMAMWFWGVKYKNMRYGQLLKALRNAIENNTSASDSISFAQKVINYFEDKNKDEKVITTFAIIHDIVRVNNGKTIVWSDSGEIIFNGSQSKDVLAEFASWLKTDKNGRAEFAIITSKLESVTKKNK